MSIRIMSLIAATGLLIATSIGCNDSQPTQNGLPSTTGKDPNRAVMTDWTCSGTFSNASANPVRSAMSSYEIADSVNNGWTYTTSTSDHDVAMQFRDPTTHNIVILCGTLPSGTQLIYKNSDITECMVAACGNKAKGKDFISEITTW